MDIVECDDCTAAVGLANRDFQDQGRDGQNEDSYQVGNKPLKADVVKNLTGISDDIALSNGSADRCQQEGSPTGPLVSS